MYKKVFLISIIATIIDQVSKYIIEANLKYDEIIKVINNFFYITRTSNTGAAFSILEGKIVFFLIISVITVVLLVKYIKGFKDNVLNNISFGLIIGGIIGNFLDRLVLGYVRDFIKINIFGYNYPIFNIADVCIVVGVILLCISVVRGGEYENKSSK